MTSVDQLEKEINALKERNRRVEKGKAWETSTTRKGFIILFTYFSIGIYLNTISVPSPWLNAIVPAIAFSLSTLTLPFIRTIWEKYRK